MGFSLLSIRKMGPPLVALSSPDAFVRSGEERPGRFRTSNSLEVKLKWQNWNKTTKLMINRYLE